jgi:hypothetical protein
LAHSYDTVAPFLLHGDIIIRHFLKDPQSITFSGSGRSPP